MQAKALAKVLAAQADLLEAVGVSLVPRIRSIETRLHEIGSVQVAKVEPGDDTPDAQLAQLLSNFARVVREVNAKSAAAKDLEHLAELAKKSSDFRAPMQRKTNAPRATSLREELVSDYVKSLLDAEGGHEAEDAALKRLESDKLVRAQEMRAIAREFTGLPILARESKKSALQTIQQVFWGPRRRARITEALAQPGTY
ncbi:MAG: hypothetical protein AAFV62_06965 [Pseudomonadota bacterium]